MGQLDRVWKTVESLGDPRLELLSPLQVEILPHPEGITVHDPGTEVFGSGESEAVATEDFQAALAELFVTLNEDRAGLGPALHETLRQIEVKVRKKSCEGAQRPQM
jgi:hypothetical protein